MRWRPRFKSLRTRLLISAGGLTGIILLGLIVWSHFKFLDRLESEARDRAAFLAEGAADKIDSELALVQGLVRGISLAFETQLRAFTDAQVRALQDAVLHAYPQIHGVTLALLPEFKPASWAGPAPYAYRRPTGLGYYDLAEEYPNYTGKDWFHLPRYLERGSWSEPYAASTGVKMVTYSVPVHVRGPNGKAFAGVAAADIDVGWLDRALAALPLGRHGYGLLVTANGTYVSHPISELIFNESIFSVGEARADPALRALGQRMVSGQPGLEPWVSWAYEEPSWLAWQPLHTADWTMATVVSHEQLRAEIRRSSRQDAIVGFAGLTILMISIWLVARSVTRPVLALSRSATTIASGKLDVELPRPRGHDEVAQLTSAFVTMRDSLLRYIEDLAQTTAARERMQSELRVAHSIQMDLLPKTFPPFPERNDLSLFALMEPAREVGGDFYDFFMLDEERLLVAIGDVSGKGVPAALFMAVSRSFLRAAFRIDDDPGRVLGRVNDDIAESNDSCMFVTLFCAVVRLRDGQVRYANAGHNPPLVVTRDGRLQWIEQPFGPAAGALPGSLYHTGEFHLAPQSMLLLYTDGVTEAMDPNGQLYGTGRMAECLLGAREGQGAEALHALLADIRVHARDTEQSDDITMLVLELTGPSGKADQFHNQ